MIYFPNIFDFLKFSQKKFSSFYFERWIAGGILLWTFRDFRSFYAKKLSLIFCIYWWYMNLGWKPSCLKFERWKRSWNQFCQCQWSRYCVCTLSSSAAIELIYGCSIVHQTLTVLLTAFALGVGGHFIYQVCHSLLEALAWLEMRIIYSVLYSCTLFSLSIRFNSVEFRVINRDMILSTLSDPLLTKFHAKAFHTQFSSIISFISNEIDFIKMKGNHFSWKNVVKNDVHRCVRCFCNLWSSICLLC